jgi:putative membrane protein
MMWDGNGSFGHGAGWEGWMMLFFMIVFVVAVIVAIVFLVKYLAQSSGGGASSAGVAPPPVNAPESPKDIVKRRYAAGEIDRGEYLRKLGDL